MKEKKDIDVEVRVSSEVNITAVCSNCGEDLTIQARKKGYYDRGEDITIEVEPHKCEE